MAKVVEMAYLPFLFLFGSILIFIYAAFMDFSTLKISNATVLAATASYVPFAVTGFLTGPVLSAKVDPISALAAAVTLFSIGFVLWMLKMLGAGDVKLMFPVGLFTGWEYLLHFALGLIFFAVIAWLVMKLSLPAGLGNTMVGMRLDEIRRSGKVPYGVVMVTALLAILYVKYFT
jgi:prepilin peptidase CpaA